MKLIIGLLLLVPFVIGILLVFSTNLFIKQRQSILNFWQSLIKSLPNYFFKRSQQYRLDILSEFSGTSSYVWFLRLFGILLILSSLFIWYILVDSIIL